MPPTVNDNPLHSCVFATQNVWCQTHCYTVKLVWPAALPARNAEATVLSCQRGTVRVVALATITRR
jgi:hypothetical protein